LKLINAARLAPSGSNLQPCEYVLVTKRNLLEQVFLTTKWAGYIAPAGTPKDGEKPVAYVIVLLNEKKRSQGGESDCAAAIENIILTAWEQGIGACWIGSIDRIKLKELLSIPEHCRIDSLIALGYKAEDPVLESMKGDEVKYWKDSSGTLHVPKRKLSDIAFEDQYGNQIRKP